MTQIKMAQYCDVVYDWDLREYFIPYDKYEEVWRAD